MSNYSRIARLIRHTPTRRRARPHRPHPKQTHTFGDVVRRGGRRRNAARSAPASSPERTRELGLLRAVGTSRRQVKRIVRLEAVITSLIGATLGLGLGVLFALAISRPLEAEGLR